ncbi:hypothetical protein MIT9_P0868 [Methylomarinovum caldicuralii]|uniref:DUF2281 domain-containing protein n=1 Tax=Methylomarinovum caldicuralii TaxID=438856 RepID=A0AAU9CE73_9GAMM|nr:DUF2281 domain-containing protein [Methylomarinovum caldicuralii]BCX81290.1 hypothetical protein MIT9_P0868 [Methylomarinovum caldicuralii]
MCTEVTARRILEAVKDLPEEEALEVLDFAEFLKARQRQERQEDIEEAGELLRRVEQGEEETIPWDDVKAEYGL